MKRKQGDWVVAGGKIGEIGHCERCGTGLAMGSGQHIAVVAAAMKAFVQIHKTCKEGMSAEPKVNPENWLHSRDTGISSCTIYAVLQNQPSPMGTYYVPRDPSDFGRCYRLLNLFPEWKLRLGEVARRFPEWLPFVAEWDKLTAMYEDASASKDGHEMYHFMQTLQK